MLNTAFPEPLDDLGAHDHVLDSLVDLFSEIFGEEVVGLQRV
jgi:hypothetical protein